MTDVILINPPNSFPEDDKATQKKKGYTLYPPAGILYIASALETNGLKAAPGTIRGDFSSSGQMNLVHAADGPESAGREIEIFFDKHEIHSYELTIRRWLRDDDEA